jgi:glutaminyl-tRNA synthetase
VWNRTVPLKDSWQKQVAKNAPAAKASAPERKGEIKPAREKPAAVPRELSPEALKLRDTFELTEEAARVIAQEPLLTGLLAQATSSDSGKKLAKPVATLLVNEVLGELRAKKLEAVPFEGADLVELAALLQDRTISAAQAKDVLAAMISTGKGAKALVEEKGLAQIASTDALAPVVEQILADNADAVSRYRAGNVNVLGALVGMVMKKTGGRANAKLVSDLLKQKLEA